MNEKGANPYVVDAIDTDQFTDWNLANSNLSNLPTKKSVYFTVRPLDDEFQKESGFLDPWSYKTGVFGSFDSVVGRGASGTVLSGDWFGKKAAFKFVEIEFGKFENLTEVALPIENRLKILNEKLLAIMSTQESWGSKMVKFFGHYR